MTNSEFSNEFDILFNNIMSNQAPGLDEYEKSVFLTKAQEDIVLAYYTGRNESGDYLEGSEEVRQYLYTLIKDVKGSLLTMYKEEDEMPFIGISSNSKFYFIDEHYLAILSEHVITTDSRVVKVVPVTTDEFLKIKNNPFRGLSKNRVLRLDIHCIAQDKNDKDYFARTQELVTDINIKEYIARVLMKPQPIILKNLDDDLEINGISIETPCMLDSSLHRKILDRAVLLAKASFTSNPGQ